MKISMTKHVDDTHTHAGGGGGGGHGHGRVLRGQPCHTRPAQCEHITYPCMRLQAAVEVAQTVMTACSEGSLATMMGVSGSSLGVGGGAGPQLFAQGQDTQMLTLPATLLGGGCGRGCVCGCARV